MKELLNSNLWDFHKHGNWVVIPTNGGVRRDGSAVMGVGLAYQASQKFPYLASELGKNITKKGNKPYAFNKIKLVTFPTKENWMNDSILNLIEKSANSLAQWSSKQEKEVYIYLPRVGCGNGNLQWTDVKPILEPILDDRFIVVSM